MKLAILVLTALSVAAQIQTSVWVRLPERLRLLTDQRVDILIEVRYASSAQLRVTANGRDITTAFGAPAAANLDCDPTPDITYRANLYSFAEAGNVALTAQVVTPSGTLTSTHNIAVYPFSLLNRRNIVLYIGDAMGTAYRDAARIVGRSGDAGFGASSWRGGYFDNLLEMDKMPVSGMAMTYASDRVVPDSANTASAWATGNKTFFNAMGVFEDGTDCVWRAGGRNQATVATLIDNPRIETLWEYLKRKHGYKTGIVTTSDVTDATPAGQGSHTAHRETRAEIVRQYFANPFTGGPVYDVILGGGLEQFEAANRADGRDMIGEFRNAGYAFVDSGAALNAIQPSAGRLLGLFRRGNSARLDTGGLRATPDGNMNVAYDKLRLTRPGSEPAPNFNGFEDQPFLDQMTRKAIDVLSGTANQPFILMVEAASIDKQSHPNHAAGTIWDTLEFDRAIGVGRAFLKNRQSPDTLLVVTADHDQSLHILGAASVTDDDLFSTASQDVSIAAPTGTHAAKIFRDANTNVRAANMYTSSGGDPNTSGREGPPTFSYANIPETSGFPEYLDTNGDGYPENKAVGNRGRLRLSVGFRTGNHTGSSVPVTAEGPGALLFTGYAYQSDLMFKMAATLSTDTTVLDATVDALSTIPANIPTIGKRP